jgi:hypothetical protein
MAPGTTESGTRKVVRPTLCLALDGFPPSGIIKRVTLAATRACGQDVAGREALLTCALGERAPRSCRNPPSGITTRVE